MPNNKQPEAGGKSTHANRKFREPIVTYKNKAPNENDKIISTSNHIAKWQVHDGRYSDQREIVIGFDLGTSCTKVVLQDRQLRKAYAIKFDEYGHQKNKYLIPTVVYFSKNGSTSLKPSSLKVPKLKALYLKVPEKIVAKNKHRNEFWTSFDLITSYIALVLLEVRKWFGINKANDYKHVNINWQLNIGLPSLSYDDQDLVDRMKKAALTGWNISLIKTNSEISYSDVCSALKITDEQLKNKSFDPRKGQLHTDEVMALPEIIAQVIGFVRSPLKRYGMYLMLDVGATTLDTASFIIHNYEGEDLFNILYAKVDRLGAYELHTHRIKIFKTQIEKQVCNLENGCDGVTPLPSPVDYGLFFDKADFNAVQKADYSFAKPCYKMIGAVLKETYKKKNPFASEWTKGLPIFLCGGGSKIGLYHSVILSIQNNIKRVNIAGFKFVKLPKPENLEAKDIPPSEYHRISVSYGLSFSGVDIGRIISPKENSDLLVEGVPDAVRVSEKIPATKIHFSEDPRVGINKNLEKNDQCCPVEEPARANNQLLSHKI